MAKRTIQLTESQFKGIIEASVRAAFKELNLITEYGLDISRDDRSVKYTDQHQENLDTSIENNPTETVEEIEGLTVHKFSIFQRKPSKDRSIGDGNPALYALKGERGWTMENTSEFLGQFGKVLDKFIEVVHPSCTIVPMPSTNPLNERIVNILCEKIKNVRICRPIRKMYVDEVWNRCDDGNAFFENYWREQGENIELKYRELYDILEWLRNNNGGIFSYHHIKDMKMRESIIKTLIAIPEEYAKYNQWINGGDILLIDDSITRGQTIRDAVYAIKQMYEPRSITVLTMFSNLKK